MRPMVIRRVIIIICFFRRCAGHGWMGSSGTACGKKSAKSRDAVLTSVDVFAVQYTHTCEPTSRDVSSSTDFAQRQND